MCSYMTDVAKYQYNRCFIVPTQSEEHTGPLLISEHIVLATSLHLTSFFLCNVDNYSVWCLIIDTSVKLQYGVLYARRCS